MCSEHWSPALAHGWCGLSWACVVLSQGLSILTNARPDLGRPEASAGGPPAAWPALLLALACGAGRAGGEQKR